MKKGLIYLFVFILCSQIISCKKDSQNEDEIPKDIKEIVKQAFVYGYPLILMKRTRNVMTAVSAPLGGRAPIQQFAHVKKFPDFNFKDVVSPNVDAFYSTAWLDLAKEPIVVSVPDAKLLAPDNREERYYLLEMLDGWSNVFDSPGTRTTGSAAQDFVVVGPNWTGDVPGGLKKISSPTNMVWILGRVQAINESDISKVFEFQSKLLLTPLSRWGTAYTPPTVPIEPFDPAPPVLQVANMNMETFLQELADLMKDNPPAAYDANMLKMLKQINVEPGKKIDFSTFSEKDIQAMKDGYSAAQGSLKQLVGGLDIENKNGWGYMTKNIGVYGNNYEDRAAIALIGLGANLPEDAVYPKTTADRTGQTLNTNKKYTMTFPKGELPPAKSFWSITMYNQEQFLAENPIERYAVGSKDSFRYNSDSSLTIYIQKDSPSEEWVSNWLPTPQGDGLSFNMMMRLYWPEQKVLDGNWSPPGIIAE